MSRTRELLDDLNPDTVGGRVTQAVFFGMVFGLSYVLLGNIATAAVIAVVGGTAFFALISTRRDPL